MVPCYHPLYGRILDIDRRSPAEKGDDLRYKDYWLSDTPQGHIKRRVDFLREYTDYDYENDLRQGLPLPRKFPCRKCLGCRLEHSRQWADRLIMELPYHQDSWFLTLTYDDDSVRISPGVDPSTGEIVSQHMSLVKKDVQDFLKRLRFNSKQKVRFFCAGEYGSTTARPHYHLIVYGLKLTDLSVLRSNFAGQVYYISDLIAQCWPYGYHVLAEVTWESAAYVARYTLKKAKAERNDNWFEYAGIEPEFQTMSNRPGIGFQFYMDHPEFFDYDFFQLETGDGGRKICAPDYFKVLHKRRDARYEADLYDRSEARYVNQVEKERVMLMLSDKSLSALNVDQERKLDKRLSGLVRDTI